MHHRFFVWLVAVAGVLPVQAETVIEGSVALPPPRAASAASSRYKLKSGQVVSPERPVAVVYLEGNFAISNSAGRTNQVVRQKGFQFSPGVMAVQRDTAVSFPNEDDDYHHVFSYSKAKEFDLGRYRKEEKQPEVIFSKPGVVRVGCEIHDHMRATIVVVDTPYFTRSDAEGRYRLDISGVPAGQYKLKAWISDKLNYEQSVDVKPDQMLKVDFTPQ